MLNHYRRPSTKRLAPVPPEFSSEFIRGGHRRVERIYGERSDTKEKWIALAGGLTLEAARLAFRTGRMTFEQAVASLQPSAVMGDRAEG
jgi:hypothetical protein